MTMEKTAAPKGSSNPTYTLTLPSGRKLSVWIRHCDQQITRKTKELFSNRNKRDTEGKLILIPVQVRGTTVDLILDNGVKLSGRSCCKPPDHFQRRHGIRQALKNTFSKDVENFFDEEDRRFIYDSILTGKKNG